MQHKKSLNPPFAIPFKSYILHICPLLTLVPGLEAAHSIMPSYLYIGQWPGLSGQTGVVLRPSASVLTSLNLTFLMSKMGLVIESNSKIVGSECDKCICRA